MIKEITKQHLDRSFDLKREILHFQSVSETREDIFILFAFSDHFSLFSPENSILEKFWNMILTPFKSQKVLFLVTYPIFWKFRYI